MPRPSKREELLRHAASIVRRDGAGALTLDAVAVEAGVSKGGVLYHFPTKEQLLAAMVESLIAGFERGLGAAVDDDAPGAFARAYLTLTASVDVDAQRLTAGLLAAVAEAPETLTPLRSRYRAWDARLKDDGIDAAEATIARLVADGLWLADLLDLAPPTGPLRAAVVARVAARTRAADGSNAPPPAAATATATATARSPGAKESANKEKGSPR